MTTTDDTVTDEVDAAILRGLIDRRIEADGPDFDYADPGLIAYARSVRAALERAHRLLPSGGEVSTQWAVRWYLVDGRTDEQDCFDNARETAEQRARRLAARLPRDAVRGEVLNRVTYVGPWSPAVSDNSEISR